MIGGSGSGDTITGGPGVNLLVGSTGGFDVITSGSGSTRVYTPGGHATVHAEAGHTIVYAGGTGDNVLTGSSTTDQVAHPGDVGTVATGLRRAVGGGPVAVPGVTGRVGGDAADRRRFARPVGRVWFVRQRRRRERQHGGGDRTGHGFDRLGRVGGSVRRVGGQPHRSLRNLRRATRERRVAGTGRHAHGQGISRAAGGRRPTIALDGSGNPIVAWTQVNVASTDIEVAHYDPTANSGAGGWVAYGTSPGAGGATTFRYSSRSSRSFPTISAGRIRISTPRQSDGSRITLRPLCPASKTCHF